MALPAPLVDLIEVRTADGIELAGAFAAPARLGETPRFDAVLMMHGAGGRFHDAFYRNFSTALVERGTATLRANNRGHDVVNRGDGAGDLLGVALEAVEDCLLDWSAWLDALEERGYERILLFGHSLGAVKSAYYLAATGDPRVTGCVLASPPRFNTEVMLASDRGAEFAATLAAAQALVDAGRPGDLMRTTFPLLSLAGAAAYVAKYGAGEKYDVFALLPSIACPVLGLTGSEEFGGQNFADHRESFAAAQAHKNDLTFAIVPDGDHHYSRAQTYAVERLLAWIDAA